MAARKVDYLLVGGFAAAHCAAELRKRGADGSVLLVGREPHAPYERPPLSKEYLRGESAEEDTLVNPVAWYEENGVELLTEPAVFYLDARYSFDFELAGTEAQVFVSATNLADHDPPVTGSFPVSLISYAQQANTSLFDVLGRRFTAGIRIRL